MQNYIALLRGINVSGHKIIKMETLRKALEKEGFENVSTYIQSGNVLFQSNSDDARKLEFQIFKIIEKNFGFDVPITVVTPQELKSVVEKNPFAAEKFEDPAQPYVAFLSDFPKLINIEILQRLDFQKDRFVIVDKTIYLHYFDSAGNTKLNTAMIENKLKIKATSRNWKTILKLIELSEV